MTDTTSHPNPDANAEREQLLERISAWIAGELPEAEVAELQARIAVDAELAAEYEAMRRSWELFDALAAPVAVSAALEQRVLDEVGALRAAAPAGNKASVEPVGAGAPQLRVVGDVDGTSDRITKDTATIAPVSTGNRFHIPRWFSASAAACLIAVVGIYLIIVMQPPSPTSSTVATTDGLPTGVMDAVTGADETSGEGRDNRKLPHAPGLTAAVVGRASVRTPDGAWKTLNDGDTLDALVASAPGAGHVVSVAADAQVTLASEGGSITIGSGAVVALTADPTRAPSTITADTGAGLADRQRGGLCVEVHRAGRVYVDLQQDPDADTISFRTPAAFGDIAPGSAADLAIGFGGAVTVSLARGTVDVAGLDPISGAVVTRGRMNAGQEVDINAYGNAASRKLLNVDWVGAWTRALAPRIDDRWEKRLTTDDAQTRNDGAVGQLIATDPEYDLIPFRCEFADIVVDIADGYARTTLSQTFVNDAARTLDGLFTLPLPEGATLTGATLTLADGTTLIGRFVERDRARAVFEEERAKQHRDPVLLEWLAGSTFQATVASIEPGERKRLSVSWLSPVPAVMDAAAGTVVREYRLPLVRKPHLTLEHMSLRLRADAALAMTLDSDTHNIDVAPGENGRAIEASMTASDYRPSRDLVVSLRQPIALRGSFDGSSGEVPQPRDADRVSMHVHEVAGGYAVARTYKQTLSDRGYVTLTFTPVLGEELEAYRRGLEVEPAPGNVLVAVDTSGSTAGDVALYQQALLAALGATLRRDDRLNVLAFDSEATWLRNGPVPVTRPNLDGFHSGLHQRQRVGATDLERALHAIVDAIIAEARSTQPPGSTGPIDPASVRPTTVYLLTDGRPTLGARSGLVLAAIADRLEAANLNGAVRLFAIAVSDQADSSVANLTALRGIAHGFGGNLVHVNGHDAELAALRLRDVRQRAALTDVTIETSGALRELVMPARPVIVPGQPLMLAAAYRPTGGEAAVVVRARIGDQAYEGRIELQLPAEASEFKRDATVRKIWAVQRIAQLYRDYQLADLELATTATGDADVATPQQMMLQGRLTMLREAIIACSLHAGVASPFTSLLIVNPEAIDEHGLTRDVEALRALNDAIEHAREHDLPLVRVDQRLFVDGAEVPPALAIRAPGMAEWVDFNQLDGDEIPLTAEVRLARGAVARLVMREGDAVLQGGYVVRLGDMLDLREHLNEADRVALGLDQAAPDGRLEDGRDAFGFSATFTATSALFLQRTDVLNQRVADVHAAQRDAERARLADDRDAARASLSELRTTLTDLAARDDALSAQVDSLLSAVDMLINADDVDPILTRDALAAWLDMSSFYGGERGFDTVATYALRQPLTKSEYDHFVEGPTGKASLTELSARARNGSVDREAMDEALEARKLDEEQLESARRFLLGQTERPEESMQFFARRMRTGGWMHQAAWEVERAQQFAEQQRAQGQATGGMPAPGAGTEQPESDMDLDDPADLGDGGDGRGLREDGENSDNPPTDNEHGESDDGSDDDGNRNGNGSNGNSANEDDSGSEEHENNDGMGMHSGAAGSATNPNRDNASPNPHANGFAGTATTDDKDDNEQGLGAGEGGGGQADGAEAAESEAESPELLRRARSSGNVWGDAMDSRHDEREKNSWSPAADPAHAEPNSARPGGAAMSRPLPPAQPSSPTTPDLSRSIYGRQDVDELWKEQQRQAEQLRDLLGRSAVREQLKALDEALRTLAQRDAQADQQDAILRAEHSGEVGEHLLQLLRNSERATSRGEQPGETPDPLADEDMAAVAIPTAAGPMVDLTPRRPIYSELLDAYRDSLNALIADLAVTPLQALRVERSAAARDEEAGEPDTMTAVVAPVVADRVIADMALSAMPEVGTTVFAIELSRAMADAVPASVLQAQPYSASALIDVTTLYDLARLQVVDAIAHLGEGEAFSVVVFARQPLVLTLTKAGEIVLAPIPAPGRRAEPGVRLAATSETLAAVDGLLAELEPDGECDLHAAVNACFTSTLFDHDLNAVRGKTVYLLTRGFVSWSQDSTAYVPGTGRGNGAGVARTVEQVEAELIARNEPWGLRFHTVGVGAHDRRRLSAIARATGGEYVDATGGRNTGLPPALETPAERVDRLAQRFAQQGERATAWLWLAAFSERNATQATTAGAFDAWLRSAAWLGGDEIVMAASSYVGWLQATAQSDAAIRVTSQLLEIGVGDPTVLRACLALANGLDGNAAARIVAAAEAQLARLRR